MRVEDINSLESEAGVIATLIHHPDFYFRAENLLPKHFTDKENEYTYTAIRELAQRNVQTVDAYNIREALGSSDETKGYLDFLTVDKLNGLIDIRMKSMKCSLGMSLIVRSEEMLVSVWKDVSKNVRI